MQIFLPSVAWTTMFFFKGPNASYNRRLMLRNEVSSGVQSKIKMIVSALTIFLDDPNKISGS